MPAALQLDTDTQPAAAIAFSAHAALRAQQRGLSEVVLDCLLRYGHYSHDHLGCEVVTVNTKAIREISKAEPAEVLRLVKEARSVYAVVSEGKVVTVGYRYRKVLRDRSLADARRSRGREALVPQTHAARSAFVPEERVVH